jgi:hypothetical protein
LVSLIFLLFVLRLVKWFINILSVNPLVVEVAQDENREEHQHQDEKEGSHQVDIWSETGQQPTSPEATVPTLAVNLLSQAAFEYLAAVPLTENTG